MSSEVDPRTVRAALNEHPRVNDLAKLVRTVALAAADEQRRQLRDGLEELMADAALELDDGQTSYGNVLQALEQPAEADGRARAALSCLLAQGIGLAPAADEAQRQRRAADLAWLAAHTGIDAIWAADAEPTLAQENLWGDLGALVREVDAAGLASERRAEALVAAAALARSPAPEAVALCEALCDELSDPVLRSLLVLPASGGASAVSELEPATAPASDDVEDLILAGELVAAPVRPWALVLWCLTGLILVRYALRWLARHLLRLRRPAELRVSAAGVTVASRVDLLGRTVRSAEAHIPRANLARAVREVRYPRLALYAGLLALAVGTYLGASLFVDGVRAGSPSLLALGAAVFGLGLLVDLIFGVVLPGRQGKVRVIIVPRKGATVALLAPQAEGATAALRRLSGTA